MCQEQLWTKYKKAKHRRNNKIDLHTLGIRYENI